jgi:hypothetical protein
MNRYQIGIIHAYRKSIISNLSKKADPQEVCIDYIDTVNSNIRLFLKDKANQMVLALENARQDFPTFWNRIGAEGNFQDALSEWDIRYNETPSIGSMRRERPEPLHLRVLRRICLRFLRARH